MMCWFSTKFVFIVPGIYAFSCFLYFQVLWLLWTLKFPVSQISLGVQNEIFMIFHVCVLSAFAEILKNQEKPRMKRNWWTRELRATEMLCFRDGVCVLVQLWPYLLFLFLVSCPARSSRPSLVSVFVFVLVSWLYLLCSSSSLCQSLLSPRCCGWLWLGRVHILQKSVATPSCPLPLTKKTLL